MVALGERHINIWCSLVCLFPGSVFFVRETDEVPNDYMDFLDTGST